MTTVYLVRHSIPFKVHRGIEEVEESLIISNIKTPLSVEGEELARNVSLNYEFNNLDVALDYLDKALEYVKANITRVDMIKKGLVDPVGCGHCASCRKDKKVTGVVSYKTLYKKEDGYIDGE